MALNDNAVFTAATGYVYTAPVGTKAPSREDLANLDLDDENGIQVDGGSWTLIGHTSAEDLPEFGYEGGDSEIKGTWQKKALRDVTTEAPADYVVIRIQQLDKETLAFYYGPDMSKVDGVFGIDDPSASGAERAILIVMVDGVNRIGFTAAKASIKREESISLAVDEFTTLPVRATFIKYPGRHLLEWILPEMKANPDSTVSEEVADEEAEASASVSGSPDGVSGPGLA